MHPNPIFRSDDQATGLSFAARRGFGILIVTGPDGVLASHLPFVLEATTLDAHVPRSNPIGRLLRDGPMQALVIVSGPDGYISPDWYATEEQVPTWNYVAVHLRGEIALRPAQTLRAHLDRLSELNEERLLPKKPWTLDKNSEDGTDRLMRMLQPLRLTVQTVEQTWKLNQNKSEAERIGAADGLERAGFGHEIGDLVHYMRNLPDQ